VVGTPVGSAVGDCTVGTGPEMVVGSKVGTWVGGAVSTAKEGAVSNVGPIVGACVGVSVGASVGASVGVIGRTMSAASASYGAATNPPDGADAMFVIPIHC
jgi:hypothetical protein